MLPTGHFLPCLGECVTSGLPNAGCRAVRRRGWPSRLRQPTSRIPGGEMTADQYYVDPSLYVDSSQFDVGSGQEQLPPPAPDPWPQDAGSSYGLDQSSGSVPEEYDPAAETLLESGSEDGAE